MTLYVYPPFFDLPSVDPVSLQFLAVSRFCATELKIVYHHRPFSSPSGTLPCFVEDNVVITSFDEFVDYLRGTHRDIVLDSDLTPEQKALTTAYSSLIRQKLVPALTQLFWLDEFNYTSLTAQMWSNTLGFPFYLFYLNGWRNSVQKMVESTGKRSKDLLKEAIAALNTLSAKLGESKYFHGNKPSSLDALLFGYLAPLLKLPLANDRLQLHLASQPNLCIYVENISSIYLPLNEEQLRKSVRERTDFTKSVDEARKEMDKRRSNERAKMRETEKEEVEKEPSNTNLFLFGVISISLSILFAVHTGIIRFVPSTSSN